MDNTENTHLYGHDCANRKGKQNKPEQEDGFKVNNMPLFDSLPFN